MRCSASPEAPAGPLSGRIPAGSGKRFIPMSRCPPAFAGRQAMAAFQGELDTECWQSDVARVRHRGNGGLRASANPKDRRRLMLNLAVEAPKWLNPGDTSWQMTAATLVGLMSVPGLAVLYGGVMQKRWSVN